jgi:cyclase
VARILLALWMALTLAGPVSSAPAVTKVGEDLYAYISDNTGSCNSTFLVTPDGVLVVDTGVDETEAGTLVAAIRGISDRPVRYIINTHYHPDHQTGNGTVGPAAVVISTEWTRNRTIELMAQRRSGAGGPAGPNGVGSGFRPAAVTFTDSLALHLGKYTVEVAYLGKGHTSGDAVAIFPAQRVIATGDLFLTNSSPAMDQGSVTSWIAALEKILRGPETTFVPGHFNVASRKDLQRFHDYLAALVEQVDGMRRAGRSLDQVRRDIRLDTFSDFRQFPQYQATFADNAAVVYRELTKK